MRPQRWTRRDTDRPGRVSQAAAPETDQCHALAHGPTGVPAPVADTLAPSRLVPARTPPVGQLTATPAEDRSGRPGRQAADQPEQSRWWDPDLDRRGSARGDARPCGV